MKFWTIAIPTSVAICFGSVIGFNMFKSYMTEQYLANLKPNVNPVIVETVKPTKWNKSSFAIGFIEPFQGLDITSENESRVKEIFVKSTQKIKAGDPIVQLDDQTEQANLKSIKAKLTDASNNYSRIKTLAKQGVASKKDLDNAQANYESLKADVQKLESEIDKLNIKSPFDGILGIVEIKPGELVNPGTKIVHLENIDNMKIRFYVAQNEVQGMRIGQQVIVRVDTYPGQEFKGQISAFETKIDRGSGILEVEAIIPNQGKILLSGMYAEVEIVFPPIENQIVLPQTAIAFNLYGESVYVVTEEKDDNGEVHKVAKLTNVTVADRRDDIARITSGIKEGDIVVTEGQVRISNGSYVKFTEEGKLDRSVPTPKL